MYKSVAIVGLGYVGLPLAVAFGKRLPTIGFDLNEAKISSYREGIDPSGEVSAAQLASSQALELTSDVRKLAEADVIIVVVPTPVDDAHQPDLGPIRRACQMVGSNMSPGTTVIFESTVFPGCTEEVCVPLLEQASGMPWLARPGHVGESKGFYVGYSPERINPGDKAHRLETIVKIVSGDCAESLDKIATLYSAVVEAGIHRAPSIMVAEAAKVIENTQRDLNIALMNELALIFQRLGIDTLDVLEAAGTKWNFLPFRPGLVGGHCIGVDPYYLTHKAEAVGHHPQVILAGRQINDGMGKFIAEQTVKRLLQNGRMVNAANVVILGLTFKEDCADLRNSRVIDVINELKEYQCRVHVHDPCADALDAMSEYGIELLSWDALPKAEAVILAVPHAEFKAKHPQEFKQIMVEGATLIDVKSCVSRDECKETGIRLWRL